MSNESLTPFSDTFFRKSRRIMYFALGNDAKDIFEHFQELDLFEKDCACLLDASGIEVRGINWRIGYYDEVISIGGQLHPKYTLAIFQKYKRGGRIALFSVDDNDGFMFRQQREQVDGESSE